MSRKFLRGRRPRSRNQKVSSLPSVLQALTRQLCVRRNIQIKRVVSRHAVRDFSSILSSAKSLNMFAPFLLVDLCSFVGTDCFEHIYQGTSPPLLFLAHQSYLTYKEFCQHRCGMRPLLHQGLWRHGRIQRKEKKDVDVETLLETIVYLPLTRSPHSMHRHPLFTRPRGRRRALHFRSTSKSAVETDFRSLRCRVGMSWMQ